jgi:TPR repeat protein
MDQAQRILMFVVITCFAVPYFTLVYLGIYGYPVVRSHYHTDLTPPPPIESVNKRGPEIETIGADLADFNETVSPQLLHYKQALDSGDRRSAEALLKHMKGNDLGDAAFDRGDNAAALRSWLREAQRGNSEAEERIANLYAQGATGVARNETMAREWYRRCAVHGNPNCQLRMAQLYTQGKISEKRSGPAYMWLSVAMINATLQPNGSGFLLSAFKDRENLYRQMTSSEVMNAQRLAADCYSSNYKHCGT